MLVKIKTKQANAPSDQDIIKALTDSGGIVTSIELHNNSKQVAFTGSFNHSTFENKLIEIAKAESPGWSFIWTDVSAEAPTPPATYTVKLTLQPATVKALTLGNYILYIGKVVKSTQGQGTPLVWIRYDHFLEQTVVSWTKQYQAYFSQSFNGFTETFSLDIDLGQTLQVQPNGEGVIVSGGYPNAISIRNTTTTQYTCGISQSQKSPLGSFCAFPLYGLQEDVMAPVEKVLLIFSTTSVDAGGPIEQIHNPGGLLAYSPGVLIDLTDGNSRDVSYDINNGWSWGGGAWARLISVDQDLVALLIES